MDISWMLKAVSTPIEDERARQMICPIAGGMCVGAHCAMWVDVVAPHKTMGLCLERVSKAAAAVDVFERRRDIPQPRISEMSWVGAGGLRASKVSDDAHADNMRALERAARKGER